LTLLRQGAFLGPAGDGKDAAEGELPRPAADGDLARKLETLMWQIHKKMAQKCRFSSRNRAKNTKNSPKTGSCISLALSGNMLVDLTPFERWNVQSY
jgi:hypothetical protein